MDISEENNLKIREFMKIANVENLEKAKKIMQMAGFDIEVKFNLFRKQ